MRPIFLLLMLCCVALQAMERPNVIIMMTDDMGWGDVSYYGNHLLSTPHLDAMAAEGLRCDRFYAGAPVCSPTRACMLTGRNHHRMNIPKAGAGRMLNQELTIHELARIQGYQTGHFGKWHIGTLTREFVDGRRGKPGNHTAYSPPWWHGIDTMFASEDNMPTFWMPGEWSYETLGWRYWLGYRDYLPDNNQELQGDDSKVMMNRVFQFIDANLAENKGPFLATIWFHTPHTPVITPGGRHPALEDMDNEVGRLRQYLRDKGISDDCLLVFCSDNGPRRQEIATTGDIDGPGGQDPVKLRGFKGSIYEGGIRVPGIIEWPGRISQGICQTPIHVSDLLPSLAALWETALPLSVIDGENVLPVLFEGATERSKDLHFMYKEMKAVIAAQEMGRYKAVEIQKQWALYDLQNDPEESINLAGSSPEADARLADLIANFAAWEQGVNLSMQGLDYPDYLISATATIEGENLGVAIVNAKQTRRRIDDGVPADLSPHMLENDDLAHVIVEGQYITLRDALSLDSSGEPGYHHVNDLQVSSLPAGRVVHSYLLHIDPVAKSFDNSVITLRFTDKIVGLIAGAEQLVASDRVCAFRDPKFGNEISNRGATEAEDQGWEIHPDGLTISLNLSTSAQDCDQVRIITHTSLSPEISLGQRSIEVQNIDNSDWEIDPLQGQRSVNETTTRFEGLDKDESYLLSPAPLSNDG